MAEYVAIRDENRIGKDKRTGRYVNVNDPNDNISQRQYQNRFGTPARSKPAGQQSHKFGYYKKELDIYRTTANKKRAEEGKAPLTRGEVQKSAEYKAYYAAMKAPRKNMTPEQKKQWNAPDGKKAKQLVRLGLRDENADYPVGETPGVA